MKRKANPTSESVGIVSNVEMASMGSTGDAILQCWIDDQRAQCSAKMRADGYDNIKFHYHLSLVAVGLKQIKK